MDFAVFTEVLGITAAVMYVGAYFLLQAGFLDGNSIVYTLTNLTAASFAAISVINAYNSSTLIVSICWILISIMGLYRIYRITQASRRFSAEERAFLTTKLGNLSKGQIVEIMKTALWINGEAGVELTEQGQINQNLYYLSSGRAEVEVDGRVISDLRPQSFIGEMTCMTGDNASATVRLTCESRYLAINAETVRRLAQKDAALKQGLELSFNADMKDKLVATNNKVVDQLSGSAS